MNKNKVQVRIGGASYTIVTEDDSEYVEELAEFLNNEIRSICNANPTLSITQAAVLVALDQADACRKASAGADNLRVRLRITLRKAQELVWRLRLQDARLSDLTARFPT